MSGKSNTGHKHSASDITSGSFSTSVLPVSSQQINSTSYIPTSSLVYSMDSKISNVEDMVGNLIYSVDNPEKRAYESKLVGTWSSIADVDNFFNQYNHNNAYKYSEYAYLALGNYITIRDGTYNKDWIIAGFDLESKRTATDGTIYDNGYGLCLIPKTNILSSKQTVYSTGYKGSSLHTTTLPTIVSALQNVLGSHIVNRNVLLSNSINVASGSNNKVPGTYVWTNAYATTLSKTQCGYTGSLINNYNIGEANYKLPVFNSLNYFSYGEHWVRDVSWNSGGGYRGYITQEDYSQSTGGSNSYPNRPMIYIR